MKRILLSIAVLVVVLASGLPAPRAEGEDPPRVQELALGEHWYGAQVAPEDLEGKVVLFVLWGT